MIAARFFQRLREDERGVTAIEFAIVAPVMCLLLMGGFDTAHSLYMRSALQGIVQKVGRDSSIEGYGQTGSQTNADAKVRNGVKAIANNATITITRRFYRTFSKAAAAQAEVWTDTNSNGNCDNGEPYQDANRNSSWDRDGGDAGQGGAKDATVYTVTATYPRVWPLWKYVGGSSTTKIVATTVLRNQPYADQATYGSTVVRNCP
ncbi:MAG: TadE/TadG family type IV pilus assembly protein [Pseudomonadota bacterium]